MSHKLLKIALDKWMEAIPDEPNDKGICRFRTQLRSDFKSFAEMALEGALKELANYGTNTHSYTCVQAFLVEFRGKV